MKKLYGFYRWERNGSLYMRPDNDHNSKKAYAKDMRRNGMMVVTVLNEKDVEEIEKADRYKKIDLAEKHSADIVQYVEELILGDD